MKKLLIALAFCMLAFNAQASTIATMGDQNSTGEYRVSVDSTGYVKYASDTGIWYPYIYATTSDTLDTTDVGKTIIFAGSTPSTFTLPAAEPGMSFTFKASAATLFYVDPNGVDTIKLLTLSAGDKLGSSAAVGDTVRLFCGIAGQWSADVSGGTFVDYN